MRLPNQAFIQLTEKFKYEASMSCASCLSPLLPEDHPVVNRRHHFSFGIKYVCSCGKASIWCNSIRSPKRFIQWINNKLPESEASGFCNDAYCGHCFDYARVIKNGFRDYSELLGCRNINCPSQLNKDKNITKELIDIFRKRDPDYMSEATDSTNFVIWNGYKDYKERDVGEMPPSVVEYFKKAIRKYGPECVGEK